MPGTGNNLSFRSRLILALAAAGMLAPLPGLTGCALSRQERTRKAIDRAEAHLEAEDLDAALAELEKAVELDPELATAHSRIGRIHMLKGNLTEAGEAFTNALRLDPESYTDAFSLAEVYQKLRQFVDAVKAYRYALRLNPDDPVAHMNLGMCYHQVGELSEAMASYRRALELDPDANAARVNLGAAHDTLGNYYEAIHAYYEALERDPHQPMVLVNLATSLIKQERFGTAREALIKAIELDPSLAVAYERMGYCCLRARDYEEAFKHYEWAAVLDPKNPQPYTGMGIVCMTRHLREPSRRDLRHQAVEYWHRALELNPDQPAVRKLVDKYHILSPSPMEVLATESSGHAGSDLENPGTEAVSSPAPNRPIEPSPFGDQVNPHGQAVPQWTPHEWQNWIDRVGIHSPSSRPAGTAPNAPMTVTSALSNHTTQRDSPAVSAEASPGTTAGRVPSRLAKVFSETWTETSRQGSRPTLPQALLHVMQRQDREATLFLLTLNPQRDVMDDDGRTPLHLAAMNGWLDVVERLLEAKAPINATDVHRQTPMHLAAHQNHASVIERLIAGGAMVNLADERGQTPLHLAARHGRLEAVKILAPKSLINALDQQGRSTAALARDRGHDAVLATIRKWGGQIIAESPPSGHAAHAESTDIASTAE